MHTLQPKADQSLRPDWQPLLGEWEQTALPVDEMFPPSPLPDVMLRPYLPFVFFCIFCPMFRIYSWELYLNDWLGMLPEKDTCPKEVKWITLYYTSWWPVWGTSLYHRYYPNFYYTTWTNSASFPLTFMEKHISIQCLIFLLDCHWSHHTSKQIWYLFYQKKIGNW